jgi:hypothetical protein
MISRMCLVLVLITGLALAQRKPPSVNKPVSTQDKQVAEPTVADLKLQVAQRDMQIADLKMRLLQCQVPLVYKGVKDEIIKAQQELQDSTPKQPSPLDKAPAKKQ